MELTKTDFIHYLNCPKSFWLLKHEPDQYPHGEFSVFLQKLIREGYEVESYVRQYFDTKDGCDLDYQAVFKTADGLFARVDAIELTNEGQVNLYEVKSSASVKTDEAHNHIKDACFQRVCAERSGQKIDRVYLVHLNGDYIRSGAIDPSKLLVFSDITQDVQNIHSETKAEIESALTLLKQKDIDRSHCPCLQKSRGNHCDTFSDLNPGIPNLSIYSLPRLGKQKRAELVANNEFDLRELPSDYPLSEIQSLVMLAAKNGVPQIDIRSIRDILSTYLFPLHFFDYETFASAVPLVDGGSPHKHFPVQYSLNILDDDGTLTHKEFLQREPQLPLNLIEQMEENFGEMGSVVSWHASFEKTQNKEMAKWFPEKANFLKDINDRMVDLEDVFKRAYVDARFGGSTSIKKVLPVICPQLGYDHLDVQDGVSAMDAWQKMIESKGAEADNQAKALLSYCKMDTIAMVKIYKFLVAICSKP